MSTSNSSKSIFDSIKAVLTPLYGKEEAQSLAFIILEDALGISRLEVLSNKAIKSAAENIDAILKGIIERLLKNEPIQYIIGETEFYGCKIKVDSSVLIPRPETEELVDLIIKDHRSIPNITFLDICTGSGCIPIALNKNLPDSKGFALDISEQALQLASRNAQLNEANVDFVKADVLKENIPWTSKTFDYIVSNPPYVTESEKAKMKKNVLDYEPHLALFVEDGNPLIFYKRIVELSTELLKPKGKLYFEINEEFGQEVSELMKNHLFTDIKVIKDFFGKDRFVTAQLL